jgi:hypothetical protein
MPFSRSSRRAVSALFALLIALAALSGCASGSGNTASAPTATSVPTATPSPTATVQPKLLYQADWSRGADGWTLPAGWHVANGQLTNDGTSSAEAIAPITVSALNYTIEARIQLLAVTSQGGVTNNYFGLAVQDSSGKMLCSGEATGIWTDSPWHSDSTLSTTGSYPDGAKVWENIVGVNPKTYRLVISGSSVRYYPGNVSIGGLTAPYPLSPARPVLVASSVRLVVMSFAVYQR